jgi:hypothetical protein
VYSVALQPSSGGYHLFCPVCGQLGPAIPAEGKDEATAIAEAVTAWNEMIARIRPLED